MNVLVQFLAVLFSLSTLSSAKANNKSLVSSFSIDLIHRDSPLSPFYNSSLTPSELIINAALRSISRIKHFQDDAGTVIVPHTGRGDYLMKIFFGTPSVEFYAVVGTASDLVWVPCLPCGMCNQHDAFDPAKSSTFMVLPCDSQPCSSLPKHDCGDSKECRYYYSYVDKSFTAGDLATETINFGSGTDGNAVSFPTTVFGCGHDNAYARKTGMVGLGGGPLSLVSQLGDQISHKFSYCLVPPSSNTTSKLKFGKEATLSGNGVVSTPLISQIPTTFYYIHLDGVTIGQKTVQTYQSWGNIVIDSGTTLTSLETLLYNDLKAAVIEAIGVEPVTAPPNNPLDLCFRYESGMEVPDFVFHFTNADLKSGNMFIVLDDLLCLLVVPSFATSYLGNLAQINLQVAYDLEEGTLSFAPTDCTAN